MEYVVFNSTAQQLRRFCAQSGSKTPITNYLNIL